MDEIVKFGGFPHYTGQTKKKGGIKGKMGLTSCKLFRKGHVGGVLENSGYLLPDGH